MTIFLISLAVLILVSGYFFFSDYFQVIKKASEDMPVTNPEPSIENNVTKKGNGKSKKSNVKSEKKSKVEVSTTKKPSKPKSAKKDTLKTPESQTLKVKRGRKKSS